MVGDTWTCKDWMERPWIKGKSLQRKESKKYLWPPNLCESGPLSLTQNPSVSRSSRETSGIFLHRWFTEGYNLLPLSFAATQLPTNIVTDVSDVSLTLPVLLQCSQLEFSPPPVLLSEDHRKHIYFIPLSQGCKRKVGSMRTKAAT